MKVGLEIKNNRARFDNNPVFRGYSPVKSPEGFKETEFAYPFDETKDDCYLEIYKLAKDDYGNYYTIGKAHNRNGQSRIPMKPNSNRLNLSADFGISDREPYAYHYLLVDKNSKFTKTRVDAGEVIDERSIHNENRNLFNVVPATKSGLTKGGAMKLVIVDSQKVGYVYDNRNRTVKDERLEARAYKGIKTIANKFGGTLAGLEHAIDNGEYDGYARIISLPLFTDDDFTGHAYWNKNCMQTASSLGNINNYANLQRKMFAHGLNFVSDGAYVNEGLQGVHFKNVLRWGEESPFYNWFKASGLKDGPLSMGVFAKNKEFISHKIVNSPYHYRQNDIGIVSATKNINYDPKRPTYIQFFDRRLVTEDERKDTKNLIKTYSKMTTPNVYDLHTHDDSIYPYAFEIDPEVYNNNIKNLNKYNTDNFRSIVDLKSPKAARLLSKFENFVVDGKFESGFETWDANPDIAKLSFVPSNAEAKALKNLPLDKRKEEMAKLLLGNYQVRDYAVTSGQYWTKTTDDILRLYIAGHLRDADTNSADSVYSQLKKLSNNKIFPKSLTEEVSKEEIDNVIFGTYKNKRSLSNEDKKSQIIEGLMNTPLDSFEFGDNLVAIFASPYVSKRASVESEIGVPRYELYKAGNPNLPSQYKKTYDLTEHIYTHEMYEAAETILDNVNGWLPEDHKLFDGNRLTEFGKYVIPLVTPEIAKYLVIKALAPNNEIIINPTTADISYDYGKLKNVCLQTLGITNASSPEEETLRVLQSLQKSLPYADIAKDSVIVESIIKKIENTNATSFRLADLIIDKTQSGLDWRIDATKDIADVEALRNGNTNFDYTWQKVTDFWASFVKGVTKYNPNAYTVAEVTNEIDLHNAGFGGYSRKFPKYEDIVPKFLRETGLTSTANYSSYFRDISKFFTKDFEDGSSFSDPGYLQHMIFKKMTDGSSAFIRSGGLDSILYSYTFIGNHDKPRALHCAALDMELFYTDLTYEDNTENRRKAYQIINDKFHEPIYDWEVRQFDFSAVSPKAVAMADAIRPALMNCLNSAREKYPALLGSEQDFSNAYAAISKSVADLAQGKYLGKRFDPDAFGIKPIDVAIHNVMTQAEKVYGLKLQYARDAYEDAVFEEVMKPGLSKLLGMMKFLVALPGMPTMFDGDDAGATGYDSKTKNMYLQGRQRIHDEWLDKDNRSYKEFLAKYKDIFDSEMAIRRNPKCNALNNGAVFTLPMNKTQNGVLVPSILRQSTDGRMAISIFNPTGTHNNHRAPYKQDDLYLDRLYFTESGDSTVGIPGLREGTKFVNARDESDVYYSRIDENGYYYLTRHCKGKDVPTPINDTTIILYHVPEKGVPLTFTGSNKVKPDVKFVTGAYKKQPQHVTKELATIK